MSEIYQPVFTRSYAEELRDKVATGEKVKLYLEPAIEIPAGVTLQSTLLVPERVPALDTKIDADVDNAIKLYEYLRNLDKTQASDKRLWIYLSHITFRDYTMERWKLKTTAEELDTNPEVKRKAINFIGDRWFLSSNARSIRRHSIARLWWAAYLTESPWSKNPVYFSALKSADKYIYTRELFATQDIVQQILERRIGWSDKILISVLEFLRRNGEVSRSRDAVRNLMKELNLALGYRKLALLDFKDLQTVLAETAKGSGGSV